MEKAGGTPSIRYNKARALLAYLALESNFHTREALAFLLWPDDSAQVGREKLRRMLFLLKDALSADLIEGNREVLRLRPKTGVWTDVGAFTDILDAEQRSLAIGAPVDLERIAYAASLYRGEFLQGLELDDAPDFANWVRVRREQYHRRYLYALGLLVEGHEREGDLHAAIERAQQWTTVAPLDETGWHHLLRLLVQGRQAERARQEFQRYRHLLDLELGTTPNAAMTALVDGAKHMQSAHPAASRSQHAELRQLTVLSCEFEAAGEPDDLLEPLRGLVAACEEVLRGAGAHVLRTLGGGLMAYFGYPVAQEDAARRAVTAALVCRDGPWARACPPGAMPGTLPIYLGLGIHTGTVVCTPNADTPDTLGSVSRVAARLADKGGTVGVLLSESTLALLGDAFAAEPIGRLFDRAGGEYLQMFLVAAECADAGSAARRLRPFCGREADLARLADAWRHRGHTACLVRGEAGLGKSHLVEHFRAVHQLAGVSLQCLPELRHMPFHSFVRWIRRLREQLAGDHRINLVADVERVLDTLGQRLDSPGADAGRQEAPGQGARSAIKDILVQRFYELVAEFVPPGGVICFDDMHWADPATREVLALFVERPLPDRLLLITARPEFVPPWRHSLTVPCLDLAPLDHAAVMEMAHAAARGRTVDDRRLEAAARRAEGIPLYAGALIQDCLACGSRGSCPRLPGALRDLLMARIDSLGLARPVAQFAASVGGEFTLELLEKTSGLSRTELSEALAVMLRQNLIVQRDDKRYAFRHELLREAAYQSQPRAMRVEAHTRLAKALEAQPGGRESQVLAWHHAGAHNGEQAVKHSLDAARKAAAQCAHREAVEYYRGALEWLGRCEGEADAIMREVNIRMELGIQLCALHGLGSETAVETFREALALAQPAGDDARLFPIYWGLWTSASSWANYSTAHTLADTLLRLAQAGNCPNLLSHAYYARGYSRFFLGRFAEAVADLQQGVDAYDPARANLVLGEDARVTGLSLLSVARWYVGRCDDAHRLSRASIERARERGHPYSLVFALTSAAELHRLAGNIDQVACLAEEALQIARATDTPLWILYAETDLAWAKAARGRPEGLQGMVAAQQRISSIMKGIAPVMIARWADACDLAEDSKAGLAAVAQGLDAVGETQAVYALPELLRLKGKMLFRQGQSPSVFRHWLERALASARGTDSPPLVLRALVNLLRYGDHAPSAAQLALAAEMLGRIQGGADQWEVRAARDLLEGHRADMSPGRHTSISGTPH